MSETSHKTGIPKTTHHVDGHFSKAQEHISVLPEFRRGAVGSVFKGLSSTVQHGLETHL